MGVVGGRGREGDVKGWAGSEVKQIKKAKKGKNKTKKKGKRRGKAKKKNGGKGELRLRFREEY